MTAELHRARRRLALGLVAAGIVTPLLLAAARWPRYWLWIASEQTPMTWVQSVVLVLAGASALLVAVVLGLRREPQRERLSWLVLAGGFVGLALDERFAVHERIRDGVLAPRGIRIPLLTWIAPGDFLVLLLGLGGLAFLPVVLRLLSCDRTARRLLLAGAALAVVAVGVDSINPETWSISAERLQQSLEEVVELAAGLCLLGAVLLRLLALVSPAAAQGAGVSGTAAVQQEPAPACVQNEVPALAQEGGPAPTPAGQSSAGSAELVPGGPTSSSA